MKRKTERQREREREREKRRDRLRLCEMGGGGWRLGTKKPSQDRGGFPRPFPTVPRLSSHH